MQQTTGSTVFAGLTLRQVCIALLVNTMPRCTHQTNNPAGMWHEWAGLCEATSPGSVDGLGNTARFNQPQGICIHPHGQLLVADKGNHCIRQITEEGDLHLFAEKI